jgi:hypothetical protein
MPNYNDITGNGKMATGGSGIAKTMARAARRVLGSGAAVGGVSRAGAMGASKALSKEKMELKPIYPKPAPFPRKKKPGPRGKLLSPDQVKFRAAMDRGVRRAAGLDK